MDSASVSLDQKLILDADTEADDCRRVNNPLFNAGLRGILAGGFVVMFLVVSLLLSVILLNSGFKEERLLSEEHHR